MKWPVGPGSTTETALLPGRGRPQRAVILLLRCEAAATGGLGGIGESTLGGRPGGHAGLRSLLFWAGTEAALSSGLRGPPSPGTSASHPLPPELKCRPAPVTAKRFLSEAANLSRFSYRCEPISSVEGRKEPSPQQLLILA